MLEAHHSPMFKVEKIDAGARTTSLELLQSVMDHHGAVVSRMVELLDASETGRTSLAKLGSDPLVCGLLVLYGVHPVALSDRVARAVELAGPQLRKHWWQRGIAGGQMGLSIPVQSTVDEAICVIEEFIAGIRKTAA